MDNEFILQDRIQKIRQIINQYGEENFYISFSGGKDSTVLSFLIDLALPDNQIPRVFANTGIDLNLVRIFVFDKIAKDKRFCSIQPTVNIKKMLETEGYPFKSKNHSAWVDKYNRLGRSIGVVQYLGERDDKEPWSSSHTCPAKLKYQFTDSCTLKISDACCRKMKEEPLTNWAKQNNKKYFISGIRHSEGGRRENAQCLQFRNKELKSFNPLIVIENEWIEWFINTYNIEICNIYKEPYNFVRTGCKGCPYAIDLQHELDTLEKFFPAERKQCELIWKPVYDEYRRIHYRLKEEKK